MNAAAPWRILSGLLVSGFLLALPGGLLPLWGYHLRMNFTSAANYFLALGLGVVAGAAASFRLRNRIVPGSLLSVGCFAGSLALLLLAQAAPPASFWLQWAALVTCGVGASVVSTAVFEALAPAYEQDRAGIVLRGGIFFGAGSMLAAGLLSNSIAAIDPGRSLLITALFPALAGIAFARLKFPAAPVRSLPVVQAVRDLRSVLAVLFALLLFFQFANEWSIAGWLPIFLIDRVGMSPANALSMLLLYWLALTSGRVIAARLLRRVNHAKMVAASGFCALFGCAALRFAGTDFGVVVAILFAGAGFSAIYPLAVERISTRFSYYHPGYFNGIFTFAMLGGILAPFLLGHAAGIWGLEIVPLAAMAGSCAVLGLILLIWLGRTVSGS